MGDDLPDLRVMLQVGLSVAPANAHAWVRDRVHWRTHARGGEGAAREVCDLLLAAQGHAEDLLADSLGRHRRARREVFVSRRGLLLLVLLVVAVALGISAWKHRPKDRGGNADNGALGLRAAPTSSSSCSTSRAGSPSRCTRRSSTRDPGDKTMTIADAGLLHPRRTRRRPGPHA